MRGREGLIVRRGNGVEVGVLREREEITILGMIDEEVVLIGEGGIGIGIGMRTDMMIGIGVDVEEEMIITSGDKLFSFIIRTSLLAIMNAFKSGTDDS